MFGNCEEFWPTEAERMGVVVMGMGSGGIRLTSSRVFDGPPNKWPVLGIKGCNGESDGVSNMQVGLGSQGDCVFVTIFLATLHHPSQPARPASHAIGICSAWSTPAARCAIA